MLQKTIYQIKKLASSRPLIYLIVLVAAVASINSVVGGYYERQESTHSTTSTVSPQDYYKSLNLNQARQAVYTNQPIKVVQNLPSVSGTKRQVINFAVPKDGLSEFGLMTTPEGKAPTAGWPVLVLCHGYTNPRTYSTLKSYLADMEFYSRHGFVVIKPDYRGQGDSLGHGAADGAYYSMSYNTDVLSLIAAIKQTPHLNKNNINIWGHSMGGYVALRAAVLSPSIKTVILLSAPVGTSDDMFTLYRAISDSDNLNAHSLRSAALQKHGSPLSNPNFWYNTSPLNFLDSTPAYIQIFVGNNDKIVPSRFSADLDSALTKLHKPHDYIVFERGSHGLLPQRPVIWKRSLQQLNKVIPGP